MIEVVARTTLPHVGLCSLGLNDEEAFTIVVKAAYAIAPSGELALLSEQPAIVGADEFWGKPGESSVRYESELAPMKQQVDLVVNGSAYAPRGKPVRQMVVSLRVGDREKQLRITGDRTWRRRLFGIGYGLGFAARAPALFAEMPIRYERAFGGTDRGPKDETKRRSSLTNPVGIGFKSTRRGITTTALPNVEYPNERLRRWKGSVQPAGFGFVSRAWQPRLAHAGTYDEKWKGDRFPLLPKDFRLAFHQAAPADQVFDELPPDTPVRICGMDPVVDISFRLPQLSLPVLLRYDDRREETRTRTDTVIIEPSDRRVVIVSRCCTPCGFKPRRLRALIVGDVAHAERLAFLKSKRLWKANAEPMRV